MVKKLDRVRNLDSLYVRNLRPLENKLLENCIEGFGVSGHDLPQDEKVLRGEFLAWLCGDKEIREYIHRSGIKISFAVIEGNINLYAASIPFPIEIQHCTINHNLSLEGAKICNLNLSGTHIKGRLLAEDVQTDFSIMLRDKFKSDKVVELMGAKIGGDLDCEDGHFNADRDYTIDGRLINIQGSIRLLNSVHEAGEACFNDADVRGLIVCDGAKFHNEREPSRYQPDNALSFERIRANGGIMLRQGFEAIGKVRLHEAFIGGVLDCEAGHFDSGKHVNAIDADGLVTVGPVLMRRGFIANGCVRLYGAKIGSDLDCHEATFSYKAVDDAPLFKNQDCFIGEGMKVDGKFNWSSHRAPPKGFVSFQNAYVKSYSDDEKSWPKNKTLNINGFIYDSYLHQEMYSAERQKKWLNRQPDYFNGLQPYSQVVKVFKSAGYFEDAKKIAIERERKRSKILSSWTKARSNFWGLAVDYGYNPGKVFWLFIIPIILFGFVVFEMAYRNEIMLPIKGEPSPYPYIRTFIYSIDVFFPVLDLHQEEYWLPLPNSLWGTVVSIYMWIHIAFGWVFTTIFLSAVTGLVRADPDS